MNLKRALIYFFLYLKREFPPVSRKRNIVAWTVLSILGIIWVSGALYLFNEVQKSERAIQLRQQQAQQREIRLRREAQLKRVYSQERQNPQDSVMNAAVDGFKK